MSENFENEYTPESTEPYSTESDPSMDDTTTDPYSTDPYSTDTEATDPYSTEDPYSTNSETTDPYTTDPYSTEPPSSSSEAGAEAPIDVDGDGVDDGIQVDTDGDGAFDIAVITNPETGATEIGVDTDGDGRVDLVGVDTDADGVPDDFSTVSDTDEMPDGPFTSEDTESVDPYSTDTETDTETETVDPFSTDTDTDTDTDTVDPYSTDTETTDTDGTHGDPQADKEFHTVQPGPVDCLPTSVSMVVSDILGEDVPAEEVVAKANEAGYMTDQGMRGQDALALLQEYGIDAEIQSGTVDDLKAALDNGDQIIVGLDAADVYADSTGTVYESETDAPGSDVVESGHAIEITGVSDGPPPVVYANDPGFPDGAGVEIPLEVFEAAWDDADNMVIVAEGASDTSVGGVESQRTWLLPFTFTLQK